MDDRFKAFGTIANCSRCNHEVKSTCANNGYSEAFYCGNCGNFNMRYRDPILPLFEKVDIKLLFEDPIQDITYYFCPYHDEMHIATTPISSS